MGMMVNILHIDPIKRPEVKRVALDHSKARNLSPFSQATLDTFANGWDVDSDNLTLAIVHSLVVDATRAGMSPQRRRLVNGVQRLYEAVVQAQRTPYVAPTCGSHNCTTARNDVCKCSCGGAAHGVGRK